MNVKNTLSNNRLQQYTSAVIAMLLLALFSAGLAINDFPSLIYHLLAFIGLLLWSVKRWIAFSANLSKPLRIWLWISLANCAIGLLAWLVNGLSSEQAKWLGLQGKFLLLPLVIWLIASTFKKTESFRYILFALFACGAICAGLLGLDSRYQILKLVDYQYRVGVAVNPIYYGDTALVMGLVSAMYAIFWASKKRYLLCSIGVMALVLGLISSGLSISRGGWLALPVFLCFLLYYLLYHRYYLSSLLGVLIAVVVISWVLIDTNNPIHQRIFEGKHNVENFDLNTSRTSAGYRLRMWHHALELAKEKPILGHGPMSYVFNDYDEKGEIIRYFHHAHNGYLQALSTMGVVGLLVYLSLFLFPLGYFGHSWYHKQAPEAAISGMLLISSYLIFVLTDVIFYRSVGLLYFLLMVSLLMVFIERAKQTKTQATHIPDSN